MADNTIINVGTGGDIISSDVITTLNGGVIATGEKAQRVKVGFGSDSFLRDVDASNGLPVTFNDITTTGTLSSGGQTVALTLNNDGSAAIQLTGTWVGVVTFEGTLDGTTWNSVNAVAASTSTPQPTTTVNGLYRLTPGGLAQIRANMSSYTSGSVSVNIRASASSGGIYANQILPTKNTDGVNTQVIKAASTAAQSTDTAAVVALSPNSPIPTGTNVIGKVGIDPAQGRMGTVQLTGGATSSALGLGSTVTAYGNLRVTAEPSGLFNDPFDGATIDTTNRWNTPVVSGFTVTQSGGGLSVNTNTTVNNSGFIDSMPTFSPLGVNFTAYAAAVKLEAQTSNFFVTNQHRFWGLGNRPASYTIGTPLLDAIGFEVDTTGQLNCVVYSNGTKVFSTATSLTGVNLNTLITPSNNFVRFGMALRADTCIFYIGTTEYPVAAYAVTTAGFTLPNVQALPLRVAAINSASIPSGTSSLIVTTLALGDTGSNANQLADGTYQWRKASVGVFGGLSIKGSSIPSTSGSIAATTTGTIGPLAVNEAGNCTFVVKSTVPTSAYAGSPVVVFEQSDDSVSWAALQCIRSDTGAVGSTFTLAAGAVNGAIMFDAPLEGVNWIRARVTTGPTTNALTINILAGSLAFSPLVAITNPIALSAGAASIGTVVLGSGGNTVGTVNVATPTGFALNSAATTNATSVKASAGTMFMLSVSNSGAAAAFLKLYNLATAPIVGTSVPILTIPIPTSGIVSINAGTLGHRFSTGISLAITNLVADTDTTAVAASQVKVIIDYI